MSKFDVEFDKPSLRINSRKWWTAVQNAVGKNSEQYREAQSFTYYHTKVRVERRNDLSIDNPGWAVIFENTDWWALYFEKREDAEAAAKAWNDTAPKLSWRDRIFRKRNSK